VEVERRAVEADADLLTVGKYGSERRRGRRDEGNARETVERFMGEFWEDARPFAW
jgi:hypothetical protein